MKKENVFENDMPTMEMETQTLRSTQQGQPIPVVGGIPVNPYTGFAINPNPTAYTQQHVYGNINGLPTPMNSPQYVVNPVTNQMHPSNVYGGINLQPAITGGVTPGYWGNGYPAPYVTNQYNGTAGMNPVMPMPMTAPWAWNGAPMNTPVAGQWPVVPGTQNTWGVAGTVNGGTAYMPAINLADGQTMLVPNQYPTGTTNGATRNGYATTRNGERDFVSWFPNVNILETDRSFKIEVCVPGVTKENCQMWVDKKKVLSVTGARRWNQETDAVGFTRKDFNYGSFACSFLLPEYLHREKITSSCRSGLLIISIPKRDGNEGDVRSTSEISIS